jgi:hypothetical protein
VEAAQRDRSFPSGGELAAEFVEAGAEVLVLEAELRARGLCVEAHAIARAIRRQLAQLRVAIAPGVA